MAAKRKSMVLLFVLLALVLVFALVWFANRPQAAAGSKTVTVEVVHGDGTEKTFLIRTDAETLRRAPRFKHSNGE